MLESLGLWGTRSKRAQRAFITFGETKALTQPSKTRRVHKKSLLTFLTNLSLDLIHT
jgi:hypothetical protein